MNSEELEKAEMYSWLRNQTWDSGILAVVLNPKNAVKLGYDCPSGDRLDAVIRAGIECSTKWTPAKSRWREVSRADDMQEMWIFLIDRKSIVR